MEPRAGIEPATCRLRMASSAPFYLLIRGRDFSLFGVIRACFFGLFATEFATKKSGKKSHICIDDVPNNIYTCNWGSAGSAENFHDGASGARSRNLPTNCLPLDLGQENSAALATLEARTSTVDRRRPRAAAATETKFAKQFVGVQSRWRWQKCRARRRCLLTALPRPADSLSGHGKNGGEMRKENLPMTVSHEELRRDNERHWGDYISRTEPEESEAEEEQPQEQDSGKKE